MLDLISVGYKEKIMSNQQNDKLWEYVNDMRNEKAVVLDDDLPDWEAEHETEDGKPLDGLFNSPLKAVDQLQAFAKDLTKKYGKKEVV